MKMNLIRLIENNKYKWSFNKKFYSLITNDGVIRVYKNSVYFIDRDERTHKLFSPPIKTEVFNVFSIVLLGLSLFGLTFGFMSSLSWLIPMCSVLFLLLCVTNYKYNKYSSKYYDKLKKLNTKLSKDQEDEVDQWIRNQYKILTNKK